MPRPAHTDRPVKWFVHVPSTLAAAIELRLTDPMRGKIRYGARSALINQLLQDWLRKETNNDSGT